MAGLTLGVVAELAAHTTGTAVDVERLREDLRRMANVCERCANDEASQADHDALFSMLCGAAALAGGFCSGETFANVARLIRRANAD